MESIIKNSIQEEIEKIKNELNEITDARLVVKDIVGNVSQIIHSTVKTANESASIDERINTLVKGLQATISFVENLEEDLNKRVGDKELQISTLESVKSKVDLAFKDKKK